jgi:hypothetical protein
MVAVTVSVAGLITDTVPLSRLVTKTSVPVGLTATPNGKSPDLTPLMKTELTPLMETRRLCRLSCHPVVVHSTSV